jgi:hypothetical protein
MLQEIFANVSVAGLVLGTASVVVVGYLCYIDGKAADNSIETIEETYLVPVQRNDDDRRGTASIWSTPSRN